MRFSFFNSRFIATADNQLEEIGMKEQHGKMVKLDYLPRSKGRDGENKSGRLYFDFVDLEEIQTKIKLLEACLSEQPFYAESKDKILIEEIKALLSP